MMYVFHDNADAFAHKLTAQGYMKNASAKWDDGDFDQNKGVKVSMNKFVYMTNLAE